VILGKQADIICNECEAVLRTVPVVDLQRTFDEMELSMEFGECVVDLLPRR
jgi:hypothetical protein